MGKVLAGIDTFQLGLVVGEQLAQVDHQEAQQRRLWVPIDTTATSAGVDTSKEKGALTDLLLLEDALQLDQDRHCNISNASLQSSAQRQRKESVPMPSMVCFLLTLVRNLPLRTQPTSEPSGAKAQ